MEFNQQQQPRFVRGEYEPSSLGGEPKQGGMVEQIPMIRFDTT